MAEHWKLDRRRSHAGCGHPGKALLKMDRNVLCTFTKSARAKIIFGIPVACYARAGERAALQLNGDYANAISDFQYLLALSVKLHTDDPQTFEWLAV
jgi:hypothetical protein